MKLGDVKHPFSLNCAQAEAAGGNAPWESTRRRQPREQDLPRTQGSRVGMLPTSILHDSGKSQPAAVSPC
jgi:hypothetical protein